MRITNLSGKPEGLLRSWLPEVLNAERVVFLPDACPGKSPLPTGTAVLTRQLDWRPFAVSDCGCGMRLLKSHIQSDELSREVWDEIALRIRQGKGGLGNLGGGNHFLDALLPYDEDTVFFLIHTGSRQESGLVDDKVDNPDEFDQEFSRVVDWAEKNRATIQEQVETIIGQTELVLDMPHNTFEVLSKGVIIRKGSVRVMPGECAIMPSHISGDVALVRATSKIENILCSMSHGTGRAMSRSESKAAAAGYDFEKLRETVLIPSFISNASLTTEGPFAYRDLDHCLSLVSEYVEEVKRFSVLAYAGHL